MNLLRLLTSRRARNALRRSRFLASSPRYEDLCGATFDRSVIATVAFNRPDVIEWQIHLVRKHLHERDSYIIFDNSNRPEKRRSIRELCRRERVPYVELPRVNFIPSFSHAAALDWITRNFVLPRRPQLVGFLDHDIFPLSPFSIADKVQDKKAYGWKYSRSPGAWYLWAGFCFFSNVRMDSFDFRPASDYEFGYLDTGGSNWEVFYRHLVDDDVRLINVEEIPLDEGGYFQDLDGWLHVVNASRWNTKAPSNRGPALMERLRAAGGPGLLT